MATQNPTGLRNLLAYLSAHPWVHSSSAAPRVTTGLLKFEFYADARLWFRRHPQDDVMYVPLGCSETGSETGLSIDREGFTVEKFGLSIRYSFVPDSLAPRPPISGGA